MISLETARQLKKAGLPWTPTKHDFFLIPFRDLDEEYFVINDISVMVEMMGEEQSITFNGTAEWALDYLVVTDAIWVPTESQLRKLLENHLVERGEPQPVFTLLPTSDGYRCEIHFKGETHGFEGFGASEVYAAALLHVMEHTK